jgi:predicted RNase H-like nuclease
MARTVAGLDGCRGGWVVVTVSAERDEVVSVQRLGDVDGVIAKLDSGELAAAGIDIPIGLPDAGPRRCDVEARRVIGLRRSSVFPAPVRGVLGAITYRDALARSRAASGKGLSRQAFGIMSKVDETDVLMTPRRQQRLVEVHPEVSFALMAGTPMAHAKRRPGGRSERLRVLREFFPDLDVHAGGRIEGTSPDDLLDAFAVAWSARRWSTGAHARLGGDEDRRGLRMEIIA